GQPGVGQQEHALSHHWRASRRRGGAGLQSLPSQEATRRVADQCRARWPEDTEQVSMTTTRIIIALLGGLALSTEAWAQQMIVSREQDIADLRLGQKIMVDDGSCPAGQIKEVMGTQMTSSGVLRTRKCVPR